MKRLATIGLGALLALALNAPADAKQTPEGNCLTEGTRTVCVESINTGRTRLLPPECELREDGLTYRLRYRILVFKDITTVYENGRRVSRTVLNTGEVIGFELVTNRHGKPKLC